MNSFTNHKKKECALSTLKWVYEFVKRFLAGTKNKSKTLAEIIESTRAGQEKKGNYILFFFKLFMIYSFGKVFLKFNFKMPRRRKGGWGEGFWLTGISLLWVLGLP